MTKFCLEFLKSLEYPIGPVLDIGSMHIHRNPRDLFHDYTGVDMRPGPNVDVVMNGHALDFPNESFAVVLSLDALEHDDAPRETIAEAWRVLQPGGLFVVSVPGIAFHRHDYPCDYWRFTDDGVRVLLSAFHDVSARAHEDKYVFATGRKELP